MRKFLYTICYIIFITFKIFSQTDTSNTIFKLNQSNNEYSRLKSNTCNEIILDTNIIWINNDELKYIVTKIDIDTHIVFIGKLLRSKFIKKIAVYSDLVISNKFFSGSYYLSLPDSFQSGMIKLISDSFTSYIKVKNGYYNGLFSKYYNNGDNLVVQGEYKKHARKGKWYFYYNYDKLYAVGRYKPKVIIFDESENSDSIRVYGKKYKYIKTIAYKDYINFIDEKYPFGSPKNLPKTIYFKRGKWRYYNQYGNLFMVQRYRNGIKHGKWIIYNPDGSIFRVTKYKRDKKGIEFEPE
jgi:hypothetical protein